VVKTQESEEVFTEIKSICSL